MVVHSRWIEEELNAMMIVVKVQYKIAAIPTRVNLNESKYIIFFVEFDPDSVFEERCCCKTLYRIIGISYVLFAMADGVVLSLGNLSTQYAWAFVRLSLIKVIIASITVTGTPKGTCYKCLEDSRFQGPTPSK